MTKTHHFPSLDQLDIQLIAELETDTRQTYKDLAAKLGVDRSTIMNRMHRLIDGDVIKTVCRAAPLSLGYKFIVFFAIDVHPGWGSDVADSLAANARVLTVHLCTGHFNVVAWALFRTGDDLSDFLSNELKPIPGVLHVETILTLEEIKVLPRLLTAGKEPRRLESPAKDLVKLDDMDLELIKELQRDARQTSSQLGRKLGVNQSTIFRRMQRLMDEHVIQIGTYTNPFALGYECVATIGLKCCLGKAREVADAIASYNQVQYVNICAGRYDISAWVVFPRLSDLSHFINVEISNISGLRDTETVIYYRQVKLSQQFT